MISPVDPAESVLQGLRHRRYIVSYRIATRSLQHFLFGDGNLMKKQRRVPTFELARSQSLLEVAETKLGHIAAFFLGISWNRYT